MGRNTVVSVATGYGLDGPGIEFRRGRVFVSVQTGPGVHPVFYAMGTGSIPGVMHPGRDVDHRPPSDAEVKGKVVLYPFNPSGPSWHVVP